jgi:hypothetical protein
VEVDALRAHAEREADELGPAPPDPDERARWSEERRGAVILLAALADYDATRLRRAAVHAADRPCPSAVQALLLDATRVERDEQ